MRELLSSSIPVICPEGDIQEVSCLCPPSRKNNLSKLLLVTSLGWHVNDFTFSRVGTVVGLLILIFESDLIFPSLLLYIQTMKNGFAEFCDKT